MMYEHLQKWGPRREEVKFFLRHEDSPTESSEQGGRQTQEQRTQRNVINVPAEKRTENGMILTVFLSNNEQILTEVPITPETTCRDVVEFCKEPGEGSCHLAEVWRGNGMY